MRQTFKGKLVRPSTSTFYEEMPNGEALLLNRTTELYYSLNPVGAAMWSALINSDSTDQAIRHLLTKYDVDGETLWRDLCQLVEDLKARDLVEITDS